MPPLSDALAPGAFEVVESRDDIPTVVVQPGMLVELCRTLRDHPALQFVICLDITAADLLPKRPRFDIVYTLVSTSQHLTLRLKVQLETAGDAVPTVSAVWPHASAMCWARAPGSRTRSCLGALGSVAMKTVTGGRSPRR